MKGKAALLVGAAVGYVLGTRDGRERYEQIKTKATGVWQDPKVQQKVTEVQDLAKEKTPGLKDKSGGSNDGAPSTLTPPATTTSGTPSTTGSDLGSGLGSGLGGADTGLSSDLGTPHRPTPGSVGG